MSIVVSSTNLLKDLLSVDFLTRTHIVQPENMPPVMVLLPTRPLESFIPGREQLLSVASIAALALSLW